MRFGDELKEIFESSPSLAAITSGPEHHTQYANAALRRLLGEREYLDKPVADLVSLQAEREEIRAYLDSAYKNGAQVVRHGVAATFGEPHDGSGPEYYDALYHPLYDDNHQTVVGIFIEGRPAASKAARKATDPVSGPRILAAPELTDRQREVLAGIMAGLSSKQIAHRLGISDRTAEMHRKSLLRRLGMRNTAQLASELALRPELAALARVDSVLPVGSPQSSPALIEAARFLADDVADVLADLAVKVEAMAAMADVVSPDRQQLVELRYAVTQASLRRRNTLFRASEFLRSVSDDAEVAVVRRVGLNDEDLLRRSAAHISKWTNDEAIRDWPGYVTASLELRKAIAAQMDLERSLLLPLLEKYARGPPRARGCR